MIRLSYNNVMKEVQQPENFDGLLQILKNEFGADHNAESTFFFLDEDGDVLSVSS